MFSCKFGEVSNTTFFYRAPLVTASDDWPSDHIPMPLKKFEAMSNKES